ncbi:hypothetical protein [Sphingobium ummariense]|uniref:Uncharacterized protein n=1 Tax=Sphingobium ummariense RL-3 TaxID=1346791 RepID=T0J894_9SPHN|nr:hypothetical protein [Sphingobium ummariense]EQB34161.1 hypothetical protein M529_00670 [Sphingobium ummariense RL-3]
MASDRMMQAIGALERAISRLEQTVATLSDSAPPAPSTIDESAARAALRSLDELIGDLQGKRHG